MIKLYSGITWCCIVVFVVRGVVAATVVQAKFCCISVYAAGKAYAYRSRPLTALTGGDFLETFLKNIVGSANAIYIFRINPSYLRLKSSNSIPNCVGSRRSTLRQIRLINTDDNAYGNELHKTTLYLLPTMGLIILLGLRRPCLKKCFYQYSSVIKTLHANRNSQEQNRHIVRFAIKIWQMKYNKSFMI